jgi:hypothetical protein
MHASELDWLPGGGAAKLVGMRVTARRLFIGGMAWLLLGVLSARAEVDIATALGGTWRLMENHRAVDDPVNPRQFVIERVIMNPTRWSDGQFDLRWEGDTTPVRGYFSLQTGRVWVKTQRRVEGRRTSVEYGGSLRLRDALLWDGLAFTDGRSQSWGFEAVRVSP